MTLRSVDFPQPDGPTRTINSPLSITMSMPFKTSIAPRRTRRLSMESADIECPLLDRTGGQAAEKIFPAKQINEDSWQSSQQHGGTLDSVFPRLRDVSAERHQGRCNRPVRTLGKGDAIEVLIPDVGELPNHRDD